MTDILPLPMGRHRDAFYDALEYSPAERIATLGDRGYDPDGAVGPMTRGDDLLPDALRDDVIERWIGDDGFDFTDLAKPEWTRHLLAMRTLFDRLVPDDHPGELVKDFEKLRFDPDLVDDVHYTDIGLGAAINMIYLSIASMAKRKRKRLVLSGFTSDGELEPHRLVDRVRVALRVLGHDRDPDADKTTKVNIAGLLTYRYHERDRTVHETIHATIYDLWAHRRALDDCGSDAALWFGVSPYYGRSLDPVEDRRLAQQLRVVRDFDPDVTVAWLNCTRPDYIKDAVKQYDRLCDLAA